VTAPLVECPACGRRTEFSPRNAWRPFCSQRCKMVDFGAWATERYVVAADPPEDGQDAQTADPPDVAPEDRRAR